MEGGCQMSHRQRVALWVMWSFIVILGGPSVAPESSLASAAVAVGTIMFWQAFEYFGSLEPEAKKGDHEYL